MDKQRWEEEKKEYQTKIEELSRSKTSFQTKSIVPIDQVNSLKERVHGIQQDISDCSQQVSSMWSELSMTFPHVYISFYSYM